MIKASKVVKNSGFTLVELLVSLALGVLLSAGIVTIYLEGRRNFFQDDEIARVQESGRYATRLLTREMGMVGFIGGVSDLATASIQDNVTADCGQGGTWALDATNPVEIIDDADAATPSNYYSCFDSDKYEPDTDIIVVKRTADTASVESGAYQTGVSGFSSSKIYLQTENRGLGQVDFYSGQSLANNASVIGTDGMDVWEYKVNIFFVGEDSDGDTSLCSYSLDDSAEFTRQCLVKGIENIQIELGIDVDEDGVADRFIPASTDPVAGGVNIGEVVGAKLYVLVRGQDVTNITESRTVTYNLGSKVVEHTDRFYRRVFSTTVQMRNPALIGI
jgi:type IV pilus assembly protein PilW